jgi:hypothetical protein
LRFVAAEERKRVGGGRYAVGACAVEGALDAGADL